MLACRNCGKVSADHARFCPECGALLPSPDVPERRRIATVLECDVGGSTAMGEQLDPESVRALMLRYFHTMRPAIERHGGTVEKFIGDAVFAVFGVPIAHEDDALRACRAAVEMRERLDELNVELERRFGATLALRIGLSTSEIVAGDPSTRETFVAGEAPNVAARLETAAEPGEILLGELTARLAGGRVVLEEVDPIAAKGKAAPVPAYRLIAVEPGPPPRRPADTPLVGRSEELDQLEARLAEAVDDGRCRLVTIVGEPGVGKSRLVAELCSRLASRARVLTGHCLAYGEGITYWPLAEIVREAARIRDEDSPEAARARLAPLADPATVELVASAIGLDERPAETGEIAWAFRRLFARLAGERALVLVVEDVHWADAALLNLLLEISRRGSGPILVVGTARRELLEEHPDWPRVLRLKPLPNSEAAVVLAQLPSVSEAQRGHVLETARGNPLFLEELHRFVREHPDEADLPPSLNALLTARLDRLPEIERNVAERASIEGELFHRGAVEWLSVEQDRPRVARSLEGLVGRELIRPAPASYVGEAAFRFKHVLVRDAAYGGTAKRLRAELHERYAFWLERAAGDRIMEVEEILGYHFEQAHRYLAELGPVDDHGRDLARQAGERLAAAGRRASLRADYLAAKALLARAVDLLPGGHAARPRALFDYALSFGYGGRVPEKSALLAQAEAAARDAGDLALAWRARLMHAKRSTVQADAERAIAELEALGDDEALAVAWEKLGTAHLHSARQTEAVAAYERARIHAERTGDERSLTAIHGYLSLSFVFGPMPVGEIITRLEEMRPGRKDSASLRPVLGGLGRAHALAGRFDEGRLLLAEARRIGEELGHWWSVAGGPIAAQGWLELLAGDPVAAERPLRDAYDILVAIDDSVRLPSVACELADAVYAQGRYAEAEELADFAAARIVDDWYETALSSSIRAKVLGRRGRFAEAETLARGAVESAAGRDELVFEGQLYLALAEVLLLADRRADGERAVADAVRLFEQKEAPAAVRQAREVLRRFDAVAASTSLGGATSA